MTGRLESDRRGLLSKHLGAAGFPAVVLSSSEVDVQPLELLAVLPNEAERLEHRDRQSKEEEENIGHMRECDERG